MAKFCDLLSCQLIRLWFVLGHLFLQGNKPHSGTLLLLQAKELKDALVVSVVTVDEDKQDLGREKAYSDGTWTHAHTPELALYTVSLGLPHQGNRAGPVDPHGADPNGQMGSTAGD